MALFGIRIFTDVIKMNPHWIRVGLKSEELCLYKKRHKESDTHGKKRSPSAGRGKEQSDEVASQRHQERPEASKAGGRKNSSLKLWREKNPANSVTLDFQPPGQ